MKTISTTLVTAVACLCVVACGAEPSNVDPGGDSVESIEQAFNDNHAAPAGYPGAALQFDTYSTRLYSNADWDRPGVISPRSFYTYPAAFPPSIYFGAECALGSSGHHYIVGISARTSVSRPHSAKCADTPHGVSGAPAAYRYLSRTNSAGAAIDDSGGDMSSWDWDPGSLKADCGWHQVVTGVAQTESNEIDGIACTAATVSAGVNAGTCNVVKFDMLGDHCLSGSCGADWAVGYYKNMCKSNQYIKGVSKKAGALSNGEISAILCCNW